jgi:beta-fructofuranosidase
VFLYRSADLVHWEYVHPICIGDARETGDIWECPDLFQLGDRHILMVSPIPLRKTLYFVGSFRDHTFEALNQGVVDDGGYLYAPQSFTDDHGRRVMFGWLWEGREQSLQRAAGWAGVMSLPRVLLPRSDGALGMQPAPELRSLRGRCTRLGDTTISPASTEPVDLRGAAVEIVAEFVPSQSARYGLKVLCAPDGSEQTLISYDPGSGWLSIDRERSSLEAGVHREPRGTHIQLADGENLSLQVFVDHSVVEVYANARACLTSRVYPSRADSVGIELFAEGGPARLVELEAWELGAIWETNR